MFVERIVLVHIDISPRKKKLFLVYFFEKDKCTEVSLTLSAPPKRLFRYF